MPGCMTFDDLKSQVEAGAVDTVLACIVDMQGRLMGKRFTASHFLASAWEETHCCNYLLATDIEMATPEGYATTSWSKGYGDYVMKPDLGTIRPLPWLEGTVMVLCDLLDHHTHEEIPQSPRSILKAQVARAEALGFTPFCATELEFFLFEGTLKENAARGYAGLKTISDYNEDYHIFQTSKEEAVMRPIRNHLVTAGIPVENSKGEAEAGQEELNIRYDSALNTAEYHTIAKHAVKEIAWQQGVSASFLPKWSADKVGSSSHVHQSLWSGGSNAFHDPNDKLGMSETMKAYMAGQLKYAAELTVFLAPYVNSYKRFAKGTFAPTKIGWSVDNRTAGFRLCGDGTKAVRVECRIGGSDLNPYLAIAALLAAGIAGIEEGLDLAPPVTGDVYDATDIPDIPTTLRDATEVLRGSAMLRAALGDAVVDHYVRGAEWEQEEFERAVTDWELKRGFERA
ncbi:glutamine synthetase family protein [Marinibacterium profundimaris]|uniref:Glutamine synthetase n=1 Tax=Marinibacterium profundimaris TaxID=1679460 RepID=A0A225NT57_9RHOB|nr:glutamine synthetase family protein [Marinibacterium profundimaris]OWU74790.1 glutamine synthetase [Marinibacterium profundimaris]